MADLEYKYYYLYFFTGNQLKKAGRCFRFKNNITFVTQKNKDLIYVGTSNGIYLISLKQNKILKSFGQDLPVKEIQQTPDGNFWFTTHNKGFFLINNDKPIKMPTDSKGYLADSHHILEDRFGFYWISSNNGLFRVEKKCCWIMLKIIKPKSLITVLRRKMAFITMNSTEVQTLQGIFSKMAALFFLPWKVLFFSGLKKSKVTIPKMTNSL